MHMYVLFKLSDCTYVRVVRRISGKGQTEANLIFKQSTPPRAPQVLTNCRNMQISCLFFHMVVFGNLMCAMNGSTVTSRWVQGVRMDEHIGKIQGSVFATL